MGSLFRVGSALEHSAPIFGCPSGHQTNSRAPHILKENFLGLMSLLLAALKIIDVASKSD